MALNEMIAQGAQFKMPDPLDQYGRIAQIQQAQNQNELAQYQISSAQRADQTNTNFLNDLRAAGNDSAKQRQALINAGKVKEATDLDVSALTRQKTQGDIQKQLREDFNSRLLDLSNNPSNANLTAHAEEIAADPNFPDAFKKTASRKFNELLGMSVEDRAKLLAMSGATIGERVSIRGQNMTADTATRGQDLTAKTAAAGQAVTSRGQDIGAATAAAGQAVTARGQDIGAATAKAGQNVTLRGQNLVDAREKENIKLRQEDQRRAADPAFQQSLSQAKALGVNIAKDIVVRNAALPKVIDTAEMTLNEIDSLIGKRDNKGNLLKGQTPHPGFENAVGATFLPGLRFVPGTDAADFQTRFDQIKGGAFLQAFETLKGGGSITNVEGEKGTSALNRMQLAQSEKEFVTAAREFQGIIKTGVERAKKLAAQGAVARPGSPAPASAPDPLGIR
jgi:hypothetical protein